MDTQKPYFKLHPPLETPGDEICKCGRNKPIKLMCALTYNPLHCIDCNLEIMPESLDLSETLVDAIAYWRSLFDAIDRLWLASGEYENWAKTQLIDIASPVNRLGLNVQKDLNGIRRCYYWYFQDQSAEGYEPTKHCPNCLEAFGQYSEGIFKQSICEQCS